MDYRPKALNHASRKQVARGSDHVQAAPHVEFAELYVLLPSHVPFYVLQLFPHQNANVYLVVASRTHRPEEVCSTSDEGREVGDGTYDPIRTKAELFGRLPGAALDPERDQARGRRTVDVP